MLQMEVVCSYETFVPIYQTTWCHTPEECNLNILYHQNLKSLSLAARGG
jgi:hypothetical protein